MGTKIKPSTPIRIPRVAVLAWLSPVTALGWGAVRAIRQPGRTIEKVLAFSLCGNVLFGLVLLLGYLESRYDERTAPAVSGNARIVVPPNLVLRPQGPLEFCEAIPQSVAADHFSNTIYAATSEVVRARFEFEDDQLEVLREITICNEFGRPWIDANLVDGTVNWHRYAGERELEYDISLRDEDGDGVPDVMINWTTRQTFRPTRETEWRLVDATDDTTRRRE